MDILNSSVNITFRLQNINNTSIEIETKGSVIMHNNKTYIISTHQGYPIKSIIIDNTVYNNFIICSWCDLLIMPYNNASFVFKHFVKKQMEPTDKYYLNCDKLKFINNIFMEIGMIPNNPTIMYNNFHIISNGKINSGMAITNEKNKLAGIVSIFENIDENTYNIYCIPVNYILTALNKLDNTKLYSINEDIDNIQKINNYKIICGRIYCSLHKTYIPVDSYIAINGDINFEFYITLFNGRRKRANIVEHNQNMTNNNIIINNDTITLTSGFVHWLKILDEIELVEKILINKEDKLKWDKYIIV